MGPDRVQAINHCEFEYNSHILTSHLHQSLSPSPRSYILFAPSSMMPPESWRGDLVTAVSPFEIVAELKLSVILNSLTSFESL